MKMDVSKKKIFEESGAANEDWDKICRIWPGKERHFPAGTFFFHIILTIKLPLLSEYHKKKFVSCAKYVKIDFLIFSDDWRATLDWPDGLATYCVSYGDIQSAQL